MTWPAFVSPSLYPVLLWWALTFHLARQVVYEFLLHVKGIIGQRLNRLTDQLTIVESDFVTVRSAFPQ